MPAKRSILEFIFLTTDELIEKVAQLDDAVRTIKINILKNNYSSKQIAQVLSGLKHTVTKVDLSSSALFLLGVEYLKEVLSNLKAPAVSLNSNRLCILGAAGLKEALSGLTASTVDVSDNDLCMLGSEGLNEALSGLMASTVDLSFNDLYRLGGKGLKEVLSNLKASAVDLSFNKFGQIKNNELADAFRELPPGVGLLDLSFNNFEAKTVAELTALIKAIPKTVKTIVLLLEELKRMSYEQRQAIQNRFPNAGDLLISRGSALTGKVVFDGSMKEDGRIFQSLGFKIPTPSLVDMSIDSIAKLDAPRSKLQGCLPDELVESIEKRRLMKDIPEVVYELHEQNNISSAWLPQAISLSIAPTIKTYNFFKPAVEADKSLAEAGLRNVAALAVALLTLPLSMMVALVALPIAAIHDLWEGIGISISLPPNQALA